MFTVNTKQRSMLISISPVLTLKNKENINLDLPKEIAQMINGHIKYIALYLMIENGFNPPTEFVKNVLMHPKDVLIVPDEGPHGVYITRTMLEMYHNMDVYPLIPVFMANRGTIHRAKLKEEYMKFFAIEKMDGKRQHDVETQIGILINGMLVIKEYGNYILNI